MNRTIVYFHLPSLIIMCNNTIKMLEKPMICTALNENMLQNATKFNKIHEDLELMILFIADNLHPHIT